MIRTILIVVMIALTAVGVARPCPNAEAIVKSEPTAILAFDAGTSTSDEVAFAAGDDGHCLGERTAGTSEWWEFGGGSAAIVYPGATAGLKGRASEPQPRPPTRSFNRFSEIPVMFRSGSTGLDRCTGVLA